MLRAAVTVAAAVRRLPRRGAVEVFARDYLSPPLLRALEAYRELLADPGFIQYFREATPIQAIEKLTIGSRPSRRGGAFDIGSLRAIPYNFAWVLV